MQASCQCGSLTAEIAADAQPSVVMCHCVDCQRRSGSPFGSIAYFPAETVSLSGDAREYTRQTDSGHSFTNGFCPACGSTVYTRPGRKPGILGVTVGTIADPTLPRPERSVYEQSRFDWVTAPEGTKRHPKGRDS
ncbi:MAG TPA: GFA family protein [Croceibacterium sp.]|nr:GFA family protein [Croceibacterium sp.]